MAQPNWEELAQNAEAGIAALELMKASLVEQLADVKALAESRVMKTEEGREIVARLIRLIETALNGKPETPLPTRHNA